MAKGIARDVGGKRSMESEIVKQTFTTWVSMHCTPISSQSVRRLKINRIQHCNLGGFSFLRTNDLYFIVQLKGVYVTEYIVNEYIWCVWGG